MSLFQRRRAKEHEAAEHSDTSDESYVPIGSLTLRHLARVHGVVSSVRTVPRTGLPTLAITVSDDSGSLTALWVGRRGIGGIGLGKRLDLEGVPTIGRHGVEMHNPIYTLR